MLSLGNCVGIFWLPFELILMQQNQFSEELALQARTHQARTLVQRIFTGILDNHRD